MQNEFNSLRDKFPGYGFYIGEFGASYQSGFAAYQRYYDEYHVCCGLDHRFLPVPWNNNISF
jgi:hypothetical protein